MNVPIYKKLIILFHIPLTEYCLAWDVRLCLVRKGFGYEKTMKNVVELENSYYWKKI